MIQDGQILPNMGVVVGLRCSRQVMPEWAVAMATQAWPINTNVCYVPIRCENKKTGSVGPTRDRAAEIIVEGAQKLNAPYIWLIDDDVEVPFGACRQLLNTLKSAPDDVMAVAGIYPAKRLPIEPVVYKVNGHGPFWKWKKDTIFECALVGMGCMMVKTEAFSRIGEKPWFQDWDTDTLSLTDDGWFAGKLELAGLKILADAHVLCTHWDNATETPYRFPADCYPMLPAAGTVDISRALTIPDVRWPFPSELQWLAEQAKEHTKIVEIGSFVGRSTVAMASNTSGQVFAVDDWYGPRDVAISDDERKKLYAMFVSNVQGLNNVVPIKVDHAHADTVLIEFPDMVFIDGAHDYESVKRDIRIWRDKLSKNGLLCGHDRNEPGVRQALNELLPNWKSVSDDTLLWSYQEEVGA